MTKLLVAALALALAPATLASELASNDSRQRLEKTWREARESILEELELSGLTKEDTSRAFARMIDLSLNHRKSLTQQGERERDGAEGVASVAGTMMTKYDRIVAPELERLRISPASADFIREQFDRWLEAQREGFELLRPAVYPTSGSSAPEGG